ncbi:hypothetical protein A5320_07810 [Rheinheimera sp. SA_1]|nr:hypothetical protein A5320_07810 [Rheinheimera sp. SA_1]
MLYWNSQSLPELKGLNFRERMAVIRRASDLLPVPKKLLLNVLKLLVLIPPFLAIARAATIPEALLWAVLLVLVYPLLTRPLTFLLVGPQLRQARHQLQFTASNSNE